MLGNGASLGGVRFRKYQNQLLSGWELNVDIGDLEHESGIYNQRTR